MPKHYKINNRIDVAEDSDMIWVSNPTKKNPISIILLSVFILLAFTVFYKLFSNLNGVNIIAILFLLATLLFVGFKLSPTILWQLFGIEEIVFKDDCLFIQVKTPWFTLKRRTFYTDEIRFFKIKEQLPFELTGENRNNRAPQGKGHGNICFGHSNYDYYMGIGISEGEAVQLLNLLLEKGFITAKQWTLALPAV
jgi:hypothetical protein